MISRRSGLRASLVSVVALVLTSVASAAAPVQKDVAAGRQAARRLMPEFLEFLRLPNVATRSSAEIRANADWLEAAFKRHGLVARQLADGDTPMVFAASADQAASRKTILFYAHMDGQPVVPADWRHADPFVPVLRACADGAKCQDLPVERAAELAADPEWRLFARAAADDKGPIMMLIAALDALKAQGKHPAINVKILIDSHEEGGPPTLADVVSRNADLLKADGVVILDGPMHASNRPTVIFGHRGGGVMRITVFGPRSPAHSGHYGNYIPNPAQNLAALVASFKDDKGRVTIPGFYDGATADFTSSPALPPVIDDEVALRKRLGVAAAESVGRDYREAIAKPSLNIIGLGSGSMGATDQSIIPDKAIAAFDLRTVPGIAFDRQAALVRGAVEKRGYHLVTGAPTDAERERYPLLAMVEQRPLSDALFTDPGTPIGRWAIGALGSVAPSGVVAIPIMGGSVPTGPLVKGLKAPTIIVPLVNADDNQHAPNENLRLGNYFDGVGTLMALISRPF